MRCVTSAAAPIARYVAVFPLALRELALAYRAFAWANPRAFELLSMNLPLDWRPSVEDTARATARVLTLAERLVGREQALEAARLATAFANGFIAMELAGAFRLGGDVGGSYRYGVDALIDALPDRRRVRRVRAFMTPLMPPSGILDERADDSDGPP